MSIHKEVTFSAPPERIYELLVDSEKFAAATGQPAQIEKGEGGKFSLFSGLMHGRHVELVPGQSVVQAWRATDWEPGKYSLARFTLIREGSGTRLILDHEGYPEAKSPLFPTWREHLDTGWQRFYFDAFHKHLAN